MFLTNENKRSICEGLDLLIEVKKHEILRIQNKTESDYTHLKPIHELLNQEPMDWKEEQMKEELVVRNEIEKLYALHREMNTISNQVLVLSSKSNIHISITD